MSHAVVLKDEALELAARGLRVFPCSPVTKAPLTTHGFKDATNDCNQIASWWNRHPHASIGWVPGPEFVVLDIDKKNGASLADLPAECLETRRHGTPSGGWHLIFRARPGARYGNGARPDIGPGIDIRHLDGYVILPPSPGYTVQHV